MSSENYNATLSNEQILQNIRQRQQSGSQAGATATPRQKFLLCELNDEIFGIDVAVIREISRLGTVTRVPFTPDYVMGVVNLRGNITAAIDVRETLRLERRPFNTPSTRIVVCELDGLRAGIVVNAVLEVADVNVSSIEPPLLTLGSERAQLSSGVVQYANRLLILLNVEAILQKLKV